MPERQVALLRSINVMGKHIVPMAVLAESFRSLGCSEVRTYIQSGNVVFTPPGSGLTSTAMSEALQAQFGFAIPVMLRSASELSLAIAANPFAADEDPKFLHAVFLDAAPHIDGLPLLGAAAVQGEQFALGERVLYLHLPHGVGRSKLAVVFGKRKFGATGTMRNWTTTLKLAAMLESPSATAPPTPPSIRR